MTISRPPPGTGASPKPVRARKPAEPATSPARQAAPRPARVRDAAQTKERILDCAMREFTQFGYDGARVDRIVKDSGFNISLVYQYFGNKESLFLAVMERAYGVMRASHRDIDIRHLPPVEAMDSLVRWTFRIFVDQPEIISLLTSENISRGRHIENSTYIRGLYNPLLDTIASVLKRGAEAGVFRDDVDPQDLFISLNGMGYFYLSNRFTLRVILGRELMEDAALARHEDHIAAVVLGFLRPEAAVVEARPAKAASSRAGTRKRSGHGGQATPSVRAPRRVASGTGSSDR